MLPFRLTAVLWLRAILLVAAGLSWDGVMAEAQARCGGLPLRQHREDWAEDHFGGRQGPAPVQRRCHGPSCSDSPLPPAPVPVTVHRVSDGLLTPAAAIADPDRDEVTRVEDRLAVIPILSCGLFRPPRV